VRWLLRPLQLRNVPMTDQDMKSKNVAVDHASTPPRPAVPAKLRDAELRVDPLVWQQFSDLVTERREALKPLLAVFPDFEQPLAEPGVQHVARRVLATDAALRDLLKAAEGKGTAEEKPAAPADGVPVGLAFEGSELLCGAF
jgi:hypothetical protein